MAEAVATRAWGPRDVLRWLRWRRGFIALVGISFMIGGAVYASTLPTLYDARTVVALVPRSTSGADSDDAVEITMPLYVAYAKGAATVRAIAVDIGVSPSDLSDGLAITYEPESSTMMIDTQLGSPTDAAAAANALADVVLAKSSDDPLIEGEVVSRALPESEPDAPRRGALALAALGAGLVVGAAATVFVESTNRQLRTTTEIARSARVPVLGAIPKSRAIRRFPRRALSQPNVGSAFRSLRAALFRSLPAEGKSIVVVTSAEEGAGKSTVAGLLAESMARVGRRVLLIDADLTRPSIARRFKLDVHRSLSAALRGTITVEAAMKKGWTDGLRVLTTKADEEAGDLVATKLPGVLSDALEHVDLIIIDAPPLIGSAEGKTIAPMGDGVLLVVRTGTTQDPLFDALSSLETLRTPLIGVVANSLPADLEADHAFG